jgi:hypothetical protein
MRVYVVLMLLCLSCSSLKKSDAFQNRCNENLKFKERFFYHIRYIDNNISVAQDAKFIESVIFMSNYAHVSLDQIMNYSRTYPFGIYEQDRLNWFNWYEENKYSSIQFKSLYFIPEVYND